MIFLYYHVSFANTDVLVVKPWMLILLIMVLQQGNKHQALVEFIRWKNILFCFWLKLIYLDFT